MRSAAGPVEWLTFPAPDDPDRQFRVNVSFLLSNYECIFGRGCPGSLNKYPSADHGCCERGVTFIDEDDFEHVEEMVGQLTAEDADNIDHIRNRGWFLASAGADTADLIGGLAVRDELSRRDHIMGIGGAAVGVLVGLAGWAATRRRRRT